MPNKIAVLGPQKEEQHEKKVMGTCCQCIACGVHGSSCLPYECICIRGGGVSESSIAAFSDTSSGDAGTESISADDFTISELTYNGAVQKPAVTSTKYTVASVAYYDNAECTGTEAELKNAGTYYAKITVDEGSVVKEFTINKAIPKNEDFTIIFNGKKLDPNGGNAYQTLGKNDTFAMSHTAEEDIRVNEDEYEKIFDFFGFNFYTSEGKPLTESISEPGTYIIKVWFRGSKNLKGTKVGQSGEEFATWNLIVAPAQEDFTVTNEMTSGKVYDGTSFEPKLSSTKYSEDEVTTEYYLLEQTNGEWVKVEHPTDAGTYCVRITVNGATQQNDDLWRFKIEKANIDASKFHAELDGEPVKQGESFEMTSPASELDKIFDRLIITYEGEPDINLHDFAPRVFVDTEDGETEIDSSKASEYMDEDGRLKPGTYVYKLYFIGTNNFNGQQKTDDPLYTINLTLTADSITELKPTDGLTKNDDTEDGGYTLESGYTLALGEDSDPVTAPLNNKGVVESGKFAEKVTGGEITGGTFANVENAEEITGGIFAQNPEECLAAGKTLTESVDQLKVVDINGAGLNDSCTVNDVIGAEENGIAVMALFAENSIEATPAAYIVGSGQKITLKNADASRTVKQWVVDFGNGTTETYNGNTAAFTVDAAGNTVTVTVVFEGQTIPTPVDPKPVDPDPTIPEVKEYTITVEDGKINGEPSATVKAGDTVNLTVGEVPENMAFLYWDIPSDLLNALIKKDGNFSNKTQNLRFEMPELEDAAGKSFTISAAFGTAETAESDDSSAFGVVTGIIVGGTVVAVTGWVGTELYLKAVLPQGASIPTNRQELALLLWQDAGKPEAVTALYADIAADQTDAQKAARWAIANGLLDAADEGSSIFAPNKSVSRFAVIKAWNQAQKMK